MATEKPTPKKKRNFRKPVIITALIVTGPIWGLTLLLSLTAAEVFGPLPSIEQIANPDT